VYQIQVLATGELDNIENFITTLENGDIESVVTATVFNSTAMKLGTKNNHL
jgi:imidazole glycerol phosphate synthase subunit HisF